MSCTSLGEARKRPLALVVVVGSDDNAVWMQFLQILNAANSREQRIRHSNAGQKGES
jgi:hypothetical protein